MTDGSPTGSRSLLLPGFLLHEHRETIESVASDRVRLVAADDPGLDGSIPDDLEILVTGVEEAQVEAAVANSPVRWIHSVSAGVEHLPLAAMAARGIVLTNSAGAYASAMAEYAVAAIIALSRNLTSWLAGQLDHTWLPVDAFPGTTLRGKRLGIVGYGAVGRELATVARAFGMQVWATKRSPLFASAEPLDRVLRPQDLHDLLADSDVIVLCASLNETTNHLIGASELAAMKPTALLVNVARGGLVDETALDHALRSGRLRGAMLDVTEREPLPADSPLWSVPNLLITPHISGNTPESWTGVVGFFCRNLELYLAGAAGRMGNRVEYASVT